MSELSQAVFGAKPPPKAAAKKPGALKVPRGTLPPGVHLAPALVQSTPWGQKALDLLLRPGRAGQAAVNRGWGAGLQTLLHSESPQQAQQDFETNRAHALTGMAKIVTGKNLRGEDVYKRLGKLPVVGHAAQGTVDATLGLGLDPTTALGVSKAPAKLATMYDEHALPAVMRMGGKFEHKFGRTIPRTLERAHDLLDVDAKTKREMAARYGPGWYEQYAQAWGARTAAASQRNLALNALQKEYKRIFDGLSENEGLLLRRAVNNGTVKRLEKRYPVLAKRAQAYEQWTDTVAHWRGSAALHKQLGAQGFNLPDWAQPFSSAKPRQLQRTDQYLQRYVPNLHMFDAADRAADPRLQKMIDKATLRKLERVNLMKTSSANLKHRAGPIRITAQGLPETKEAEQAFMRSAARNISAKDLERRIAPQFAEGRRRDAFDVFRYQNAPGQAQFSPGRTGTFYAIGKPKGIRDAYNRSQFSEVGGQHVVSDSIKPHNPLVLEPKRGSVGAATLIHFLGKERATPIINSVRRIAQGEQNSVEDADRFATELGINPPGMDVTPWEKSITSELGASYSAMLDRLGNEIARQRGHDAIIMRGAGDGGTDQLVRLYEPGLRSEKRFKNLPAFMKEYLNPKIDPVRDAVEEHAPLLNTLQQGTQLGKAGLFYSPFPHTRNIAFLQLLADPGAIPATLANFAKLRGGFVSPEARARILDQPIKAGAVGAENAEAAETAAAARNLLNRLPDMGELTAAGKLAAKPVQGLYGASNKALWAFDDAAKTALMKRNMKRGMSPERASLESNLSLVNYNEASPFTQGARYAFPFATWRTKMPLAVGRSVLRNPQNAAALARLDPRLTGGQGPPAPWQDKKKKSSLTTPLGEVLGGLDDQLAYGRGSLTTTLRELANLPSNAIVRHANSGPMIAPGMPGSKLNYFTYGQKPLPYALEQLPYLGQAMDMAGKGTFTKKPGQALLENVTGLRETFPKRARASTEELRGRLFDAWQAKHPNADFKRVNYVKAYINYLRGAKLVEDLKALGVQP